MCNNWSDFPISVYEATGGLIGDSVIICGGWGNGYNTVKECYSLTSEKATFVTHMSVGRASAASIVINDNTLWVTGGSGGSGSIGGEFLASTEYVTLTETMPGPTMPIGLFHHAMVAINSTFSMVIGGTAGNWIQTLIMTGTAQTILTYFYDHNEEEWITGPSLMQARESHAAGIVTDEVTGEHFVAVTGGINDDSGHLNSTEILQDGEWVQGKINDTICHLLKTYWLYNSFLLNTV
jgi:hypothetical protein